MKRFLIVCVLLIVGVGAAGLWWLKQPLPIPAEGVAFTVPPGVSVARVTRDLEAKGLVPSAQAAKLAAQYWGIAPRIQAGEYTIQGPHTLRSLLESLTEGKSRQLKFTIVEGWTTREMLDELSKAPETKLAAPLTKERVAQTLNLAPAQLEGQFFPDTYYYMIGGDPISIVKQAHAKLKRELSDAWEKRVPGLPYANSSELLIMASIVEKETGKEEDRDKVASVFVNRQKIGMRLQTDPSVIYGLGDKFDGNLTRAHLQADTPYNTYTRAGFPPTPIALPGKASLLAAIKPAETKYMYFVARGDGTSQFSETLDAHNRAVAKYQLGK
jgi:UPF0755 protein